MGKRGKGGVQLLYSPGERKKMTDSGSAGQGGGESQVKIWSKNIPPLGGTEGENKGTVNPFKSRLG